MRRLMAAGLLSAGLVAGSAGPAMAKPPIPVEPSPPLVVEACGTQVTLTDVVNKGRIHTKKGSATTKTTGALKILATTPDGRSVLLNASGPARRTPTGTGFRLEARGQNISIALTEGERAIHEAIGLPVIALTSGPLDATLSFDETGQEIISIDLHRRPPRVVDVCDLL